MSRRTGARPRPSARQVFATGLALVLLVAIPGLLPAGAQEVSDTISIVKDDEAPSNAEIAARLSEATFDSAPTVVLGRDDEFADAMASAVLQADSPLLLTSTDGPLPDRVRDEILRQGADRVVMLGGVAALSEEVEDEVSDLGITVERREGPSRFETAVDIAATDAPEADTVILARAFSGEGGEPTQAFADSIAAGGLSAEEGWPILLSQTEVLTGSTRDYLAGSSVQTVLVIGGTAAISAGVEAELRALDLEVERIAGDTRAETAIAIAEKRGADSAADVGRTILVDSESDDAWAGGFAAAGHSAVFDAPVVLAREGGLPRSTLNWLEGTSGAPAFAQDADGPVLTCVTVPAICEEARVALGLPPQLAVAFEPEEGSEVQQGSSVRLLVSGEGAQGAAATAVGDCVVPASGPTPVDTAGGVSASIRSDAPLGSCGVEWSVTLSSGAVQTVPAVTYVIVAPPPPPPPPPAGPTANFDAVINGCNSVQFTSTSTAGDAAIVGYEWLFGETSTTDSTEPNPTHIYDSSGTFSVTLRVTDEAGRFDDVVMAVAVTCDSIN